MAEKNYKKIVLFFILIVFISCSTKYAEYPQLDNSQKVEGRKDQYQEYKLSFKGGFFSSPKFIQDDEAYTKKGVEDIIKMDEKAYSKFKNGEIYETIANIIGSAGGFCAGYYLGKLITNQKPSIGLLGAGIGCILLDVLIYNVAINRYEESAECFNKYLQNELELSDQDIVRKRLRKNEFHVSLGVFQVRF